MGQDAVERFLGRIITDDVFREMLKIDFVSTCMKEGFVFTEREFELLKGINLDSFEKPSEELDSALKRGRCRIR